MIAKTGFSSLALEYCESIARAGSNFSSSIKVALVERIIVVNMMINIFQVLNI